jgi:hypothetical protein
MAHTHWGDNSYRLLVAKSEGRNPFWALKNVYEDKTKVRYKAIMWGIKR